MTVISPAHPTYVVSPVTDVPPDELTAAIAAAEPGALLMALVHLTGDTGLVDEFRAGLDEDRRRAEAEGQPSSIMGQFPDSVAAEVRERARRLLGTSLAPRITVPDDELFRRMAEV